MLPEFPEFKKIELSDKEEIEKYTKHFPHYSDFNFSSIWSWDINHETQISQLNGNLVLIFSDYVSGEKFLSFIGDNKALETASTLISYSEKHYNKKILKLIPEEISRQFKNSNLKVKPDRDSFDYIYLVEHLVGMNHWNKHTAGRGIKKFIKVHPNYSVKELTLEHVPRVEYERMFEKWSTTKEISNIFEFNEYKAFKRLVDMGDKNIKFISVHVDDKLAGFSVYETLSDSYALAHFSKADIKEFPGIYDLLNWEEAKFFEKRGVKYLNWEQDLGIPGLRYSKTKYKPAFFLRKLEISL